MFYACFSPQWFTGIDAIAQILFVVIGLILAINFLRLYRRSTHAPFLWMALGFASIACSYIAQSYFNILVLSNGTWCTQITERTIAGHHIAVLLHMGLKIVGLILLTSAILPKRSNTNTVLLLAASIIAVCFASNMILAFGIVSLLYLGTLALHFLVNCVECGERRAMIVSAAFAFLLLGWVDFFFVTTHSLFYVIGNVFELIGYILLLIHFLVAFWYGKKKR